MLHRKAPDRRALLCAAVTLAGVGFLTLKNGLSGFGLGEGLCLMEACLYGIAIILTAKFSHEGDAILLGIVMHNYHKSGVKDSDAAVEGSETSHAA